MIINLINVVKGIFIGIALVIPGLSGSIFAVVVGLYDKILFTVNNFKKNKLKSVKFLTPIIFGCIIGVLLSTKIVLWICENYTHESYSFFIGLVIGSIPIVVKKVRRNKFNPFYLIFTIIGFVFIYLISNIDSNYSKNYIAINTIQDIGDVFTIFFAGLFSCSLMAIPGVSGSIMLMVINQYGTIYNAIGKFSDFIIHMINKDIYSAMDCLKSIFIILPFIIGAFIGFIFISKLLIFLLSKFESITYCLVGGLVAGAIYTLLKNGIFPYAVSLNSITSIILLILIDTIFCIIGIYCSIFFEK